MIALLFAVVVAHAQVKEVQVQVKGLVCAFCANGLKATLARDPAVEASIISLEKRQLRLFVKNGRSLSDADIERLVDEAGFKVEKIDRLAN